MQAGNGKQNGAGKTSGAEGSASPSVSASPSPPPRAVAELAEACVRYVERALGVRLDYQPETLPLLDHYIEQARAGARERPETRALVAHTCGAYLGEVVRRRYTSWWRAEGDDPADWQVELESVFLAFNPVGLVLTALQRGENEGGGSEERDAGGKGSLPMSLDAPEQGDADFAPLVLEEEDRVAVSARLAELPPVSEEEFYAPSTRLEVIDIAVEAIRARRMAEGEQVDAMLRPEDYERAE